MRTLTFGYGTSLVALGVGGYLASGRASKTALIPAAIGLPVVGLAALSAVPGLGRVTVGAATALAMVGLAGSSRGFAKLPELLQGRAERPLAVASQCAMAVLSAGYAAAGVRHLTR